MVHGDARNVVRETFAIGIVTMLLAPAVQADAQTMQAPIAGHLTATQVGIEPMMGVDAATYASLARTNAQFDTASARVALMRSRSPRVRAFATKALHDHSANEGSLAASRGPARRLAGTLDYRAMLDTLKRVNAAAFDRLYTDQQMLSHRHAWALDSGYAVDGRDPRLRDFARRAVAIDEAHLARLPMKPMRY